MTQDQRVYSPEGSSCISYGSSYENLFEHQDVFVFVIISLILITSMFHQAAIL